MKPIPRGAWQYATLLIVLFAIAAIAAYYTIDYLQDLLSSNQVELAQQGTMIAIWALTLGFMFLAGGFGLWAIQFSAESESSRRVGLLVEHMHYLRDGLVSLDKKGRIIAANPALMDLTGKPVHHQQLQELFQSLSDTDMTQLLDPAVPTEVERDIDAPEGPRTLRFRSQPSSGLRLVLISDITRKKIEDAQKQHVARFQLIGRIARGVAHDFNNILCAVSGHAALALRMKPGSQELAASMESIIREAQRGSELATHLSDLSRSSAGDVKVAFHPEEHVAKAAELLQLGLSPAWQVQAEIRSPLSPVPMSGLQLEQAVLNLGLLAADARSEPGVVRIIAGRPLPDSALDAGQRRAIVVLISAGDTRARSPLSYPLSELTVQRASEDGGVIQSVVRAMVEGSEGDLTLLRASDGTTIYRIGLPSAASTNPEDADQNIPPELRAYVAHWRVLAAVPKLEAADLDLQLRKAGLTVEKVETTPSALSRLDEAEKPDVVIWDRRLLRAEAPSLLRIAAKLCPGVGIVVLEEGSEVEGKEAEIPDVVLLPRRSHTVRLLRALIEAKGLAIRRQNR